MKTFPDPLQKSQPPTPELLAQFAAQSRAAADEMQKQGIPLPPKPDDKQAPQEYLNLTAWEREAGPSAMETASKQQPLTFERFMRSCNSGVRKTLEKDALVEQGQPPTGDE